MNQELLLLLGTAVKEKRNEKNITLDKLATKAGVTKGLISQIENGRSIPSLPVLFDLIHALDENIRDFFANLHESAGKRNHIIVVNPAKQTIFKKEPVKGFQYKRILTQSVMAQTIDVAILELKPLAIRRKFIKTEAFELKYIIEGNIEYQIEDTILELSAGDTLFFDGRVPHRVKNTGNSSARILIIYFF